MESDLLFPITGRPACVVIYQASLPSPSLPGPPNLSLPQISRLQPYPLLPTQNLRCILENRAESQFQILLGFFL